MSIHISKIELKKVVREELNAVLSEQQWLHELHTSKEVEEGCEGSAWHGLDGKFVNPSDEAGSYSIRDKSCKRAAQRKRPKASKYSVAIPVKAKPCGRGSKYLCKDSGKNPKWESKLITDEEESVSGPDKAYIAGLIQQEFARYTNRKPSGCTVDYCAKLVNGIIAASKGEMYTDAKS